jgi:hypothetical protein
MPTVQVVAVPLHAPLQPENLDPPPALAVSLTDVPALYDSLQSEPQEMPAGDDVTVPDALLPALATVTVSG